MVVGEEAVAMTKAEQREMAHITEGGLYIEVLFLPSRVPASVLIFRFPRACHGLRNIGWKMDDEEKNEVERARSGLP